ncbi:MAG: hypothetical protein SCH98_15405 [Deferrisomatales bacterium]|nr:hypothetical protein [Deferrisomatales bacterium]
MRKLEWLKLAMVGLVAAPLALTGCGSDGSDGAQGPPGPPGPSGTDAPVTATAAADTCVVCHGDASVFSARENHDAYLPRAANWTVREVLVTPATVDDPAFVDITVSIDDQDQNLAYTTVVNVRALRMVDGVRTSTNNAVAAANATVDLNEDGDHVITLPIDLATLPGWTPEQDVTWRVRLNSGVTYPEAAVIAYQNVRVMTPVRDQGCVNCHGPNIFVNAMGGYDSVATGADGNRRAMGNRTYHFSAYGVESCVMCHGNADGAHGDRLLYYAHGIHQSNKVNKINNEAGSLEVKEGWFFSVRYPGDNQNCSACHMTDADLAAVLAEPVTRPFCGSCHGEVGGRVVEADNVTIDWDSFTWSTPGNETLHRSLGALVDCQTCHDGTVSPRTVVGDFHLGFNPEMRAAENIEMEITAVEAAGLGAPIQFHWEARRSDASLYDACNATVGPDAPVFLGQFSVRIAYYQGDDIANVGVGSYGQPGATTNLTAENTVCDVDGRATTTVNLHTGAVAERAQITFDGRPRIDIQGFANQQARVPVPAFSFLIADGTPAPRRQIVDTNKCIGCHRGNMYRHGGGRNDNIESCIACHNPSATDQGVRVGLGIDASNAYDRKNAESFSMAYNMHAVHGVGERDAFYLVYRNRGLYGYGSHNTPLPPNWPLDSEGNPAAYAPGLEVFGSNPPANITHYLKKVNFPNRLNNCLACHIEGAYGIPDQSKALAISIESGDDGASQLDDTLISPATGACMACHQAGDPAVQAALRNHAYQFSWRPSVIEGGKEAVLEAAQ